MPDSDSQLQVGVLIDTSAIPAATSQVSESVQLMADRIKAAFGSIEKAPEGVKNAFLVMQNSTTQSSEIVSASVRAINEALKEAGAAGEASGAKIEEGMNRAARGANNARIAFSGLTRDLGLTGNRALASFIAQSESLGPILNSAFTGIAVVGFIELAVQAAEKISKFIEETFIFTKAEQDAFNVLKADNAAILANEEQHKKNLQEISLIGLSAAAADKLRAQYAKESNDSVAQEVVAAQRKLDAAREEVKQLTTKQALLDGQTKAISTPMGSIVTPAGAEFQKVSAALVEAQAKIPGLSSALDKVKSESTLATDRMSADIKRWGVAVSEESEKARAELERTFEEGAELGQEWARKDLAAVTKDLDERMKAAKEAMDWSVELSEKGIEAEQKAFDKANKERLVAANREADEELRSALDTAKKKAEAQISGVGGTGLNPGAELAAKKAILDQQFDADREASLKRISQLNGDNAEQVAKAQEVSARLIGIWQTMQDKKAALDEKYRQSLERSFDSIIGGPLDHFVDQAITGQKSIGASFEELGVSMLRNLTESLAKMELKRAEDWALQKVEHALGIAANNATDAAGAAAKQTVSNEATIQGSAGAGAAAGFASVMEALPFPFNVAVAPGIAASTLAQIEAFGSIAAFAQGGIVPDTGLAWLHGGEMVLPKQLSDKVQNATDGGSGGDTHVHLHINAIDAASFDNSNVMKRIQKKLTSHLRNIGITRK
jgi:hypothetical protein